MKKQPNQWRLGKPLLNYDLKMKLTTLFLITTLFGLQANNSNGQNTKVTLDLENTTVREIIDKIESSTELRFIYKIKDVNLERKMSLKVESEQIETVLNAMFQNTITVYRIRGKHIVLRQGYEEKSLLKNVPKENSIYKPQDQIITGTVLDGNGTPLPGASVVEKGTTNGVQTDFDGNFSLDISDENAILVISYIGFATKEILVDGQTNLAITLNESTAGLDEVVVVGFGVQKKVNLTGAISTVTFDEELSNRPLTNASQALGGTASGIWVSQNSGQPGNDAAQIRVRGWGTLNNSDPLILIDGIEGTFNQLNPNDIDNISVLKDAASAAIYGSKASNGVVLITTKAGTLNEKMVININSYVGLQSLGERYDMVNNSAESMELTNLALSNDGVGAVYPQSTIQAFRSGNDPFIYPNTDWFKTLFRTAEIQEHNLSIRGGNEKTSSYLSFNYLDQEGIIPNTQSQRYGLRVNVESKINNWLKVSAKVNYINRNSEEPYSDVNRGSLGRVYIMLEGATPFIAPFTSDGRFGSVQAFDEDGVLLYDNRNALIDAANGSTSTVENTLNAAASVDIKFTDFLSFSTTLSTNRTWNLQDRWNESLFGYTSTGIETITKNYNREGLEVSRNQITSGQDIMFATLNFQKSYADKHNISALAGMQFESTKIRNVFARRTNPPKEGLTQVDAGTEGIQGSGNFVGFNMLSYFGRINYSFLDKYLVEANIRTDGSSRFKEGNRWGVFPGFSAGWRLSQEKFIQDLNVFTNLKLRASWGQLGNQNLNTFWPYLTVINQNNDLSYNFNGGFAPGAANTTLVDEDITWETSTTFDVGLDIGLLNGKVTIEADYFKKTTEDILVQLPIPQLLGGVTPPFENVGEMVNEGFDLVVNYDNGKFDRSELGFQTGFNITYIDNEVTKFRGGNSPDQLYLIREGQPYRSLYAFKVEGIYQTDQEGLNHMPNNSFKPVAGNLRYVDVNGDGQLNFEDKQVIGNTIPELTFGISQTFKYKGVDLNFLFQGLLGADIYNQNNFTKVAFENRILQSRWKDAWSPDNTNSNLPQLRLDNNWDNQQSSFWVQKLDYIKLKNLQLGYSFPESIIKKIGLNKLYLYANAQNVFAITPKDYDGFDPETDTFNNGAGVYPIPRIISIGLNINF